MDNGLRCAKLTFTPKNNRDHNMSKGKRDTYTSEFKFKVAIEAMIDDKTLAQLASEYHVHPSQVTKWKVQLKGSASAIFGSPSRRKKPETITEAF